MNAGIADIEKTSINRQLHWKNTSAVMNNHVTTGIVGSSAFYVVRAVAI
jgi:hypothetical protein